MAINLSRKITSIIQISRPTLNHALDSSTRAVPNSLTAFLMSSFTTSDNTTAPESKVDGPEKTAQNKEESESGSESSDDEDNGGVHVNKETGEVGGPKGPEPTRYGDWEKGGRCSDF